jgi:hypothetical protein
MHEYVNFDWISYFNFYSDLREIGINTKVKAWNHWITTGKKEGRLFFDLKEIKNFDWKIYVNNYPDLRKYNLNTSLKAYHHWVTFGKNQERTCLYYNTSKINYSGFGNLFFINMACHFLSLKYNLKFEYKYYDLFQKLGITLFIGNKTYNENILLTNTNFYDLIKNDPEKQGKNIILAHDLSCHSKKYCYYLKKYFKLEQNKNKIIQSNIFKERYVNNNDVFVHVRLGDVRKNKNHNLLEYYDDTMKNIRYERAYISSDEIENTICQELIRKFNMIVIDKNEIETIMFGSTCKYMVLSGGAFSWLIGFMGFFSTDIYYPCNKNPWYGDIFVFNKWKSIDFLNTHEYNLKKNIADEPTDEWYDSPFDNTDYTIKQSIIKDKIPLVVKSK